MEPHRLSAAHYYHDFQQIGKLQHSITHDQKRQKEIFYAFIKHSDCSVMFFPLL